MISKEKIAGLSIHVEKHPGYYYINEKSTIFICLCIGSKYKLYLRLTSSYADEPPRTNLRWSILSDIN